MILEGSLGAVDHAVDIAVATALSASYEPQLVVRIGLLSGCYLGLDRLVEVLAVELEVDFVGRALAGDESAPVLR